MRAQLYCLTKLVPDDNLMHFMCICFDRQLELVVVEGVLQKHHNKSAPIGEQGDYERQGQIIRDNYSKDLVIHVGDHTKEF